MTQEQASVPRLTVWTLNHMDAEKILSHKHFNSAIATGITKTRDGWEGPWVRKLDWRDPEDRKVRVTEVEA